MSKVLFENATPTTISKKGVAHSRPGLPKMQRNLKFGCDTSGPLVDKQQKTGEYVEYIKFS